MGCRIYISVLVSVIVQEINYGKVFTSAEDCLVDTRYDLPLDKQPLYIQNGALAKPTLRGGNSYLIVPTGKALHLSCPGRLNFLDRLDSTEQVECIGGKTFLLRGAPVNLRSIRCVSTVAASLNETQKPCGRSTGRIIKVGFKLWQSTKSGYNSNSDWFLELFEVCFDYNSSVPLYVRHVVDKLITVGNEKYSKRPWFQEGSHNLFGDIKPDHLYKKTTQVCMMANYLNSLQYFNEKNLFLTRGHLAPDADFIFTTSQFATYFYINAAPQWNKLNSGNWLSIERAVRKLANNTGRDVRVTTGTHGVLMLEDGKGNTKPIYLDPTAKAVPVPHYFWKAVSQPGQGSIVFLMENHPKGGRPSGPLCRDICRFAGWNFDESHPEKGLVTCCGYRDAMRLLPNLPTKYKRDPILQFRNPR